MRIHQLWAGTLLLITATALRSTVGGGWELVVLVLLGLLLVFAGHAPEGEARRAG